MKRPWTILLGAAAAWLSVAVVGSTAYAQQCGGDQQIRLGPVPVGDAAGTRFNYVNSNKRGAAVTANFYSESGELLSSITEGVAPGKGTTLDFIPSDGTDFVYVIADVSFDDPIIAFDDPIIAFDDPIIAFQVPVFLTSLETYDDNARTGIWGTDGTAIWGTNGTSKPTPTKAARSRQVVAFPPVTVAAGESVTLAVTNGSDNDSGQVYLKLLDIADGTQVDDGDRTFCELVPCLPGNPCPCGGKVCQICEPKTVPIGGTLDVRFSNGGAPPTTVIPVMEAFDDPIIAVDDPIGFQVPVFMPTLTVRGADGVKDFMGAAQALTPPSCQR